MSECVDLYSAQSLEYNALDALVTRANKYVLKAKFHYTDPTRTGPDPHGPNGVSPQKKVRAGPCGSGRVRVGSVSV